MSDPSHDTRLRDMLAKDAIRDCIHRYSRAVDRGDLDLYRGSFWPDAIDEHGTFNGPVSEFLAWAATRLAALGRTSHMLGQIIIDVDGDTAGAETYFTAYSRKSGSSGDHADEFIGGRFVDRLLSKQGEWRIQHRIVVYDWLRRLPDSFDFETVPQSSLQVGRRGAEDPLYRLLGDLIPSGA